MAGDRPVGALNIYSRYRAPFGAAEQELASIFVTEASVLLRDGGADVSDAALAGRLNEALSTRKLIAQAQGVVVTREGVTADDAYTVLRRFSVGRGQRLGDLADEVVASIRRSSDGPRLRSGPSSDHRQTSESAGRRVRRRPPRRRPDPYVQDGCPHQRAQEAVTWRIGARAARPVDAPTGRPPFAGGHYDRAFPAGKFPGHRNCRRVRAPELAARECCRWRVADRP